MKERACVLLWLPAPQASVACVVAKVMMRGLVIRAGCETVYASASPSPCAASAAAAAAAAASAASAVTCQQQMAGGQLGGMASVPLARRSTPDHNSRQHSSSGPSATRGTPGITLTKPGQIPTHSNTAGAPSQCTHLALLRLAQLLLCSCPGCLQPLQRLLGAARSCSAPRHPPHLQCDASHPQEKCGRQPVHMQHIPAVRSTAGRCSSRCTCHAGCPACSGLYTQQLLHSPASPRPAAAHPAGC